MPSNQVHFVLAQGFREGVGKELSEFLRATTEAGQTTVWLVGLSSSLLALSVADPRRLAAVVGAKQTVVSLLLLLTIAAGVMHRLLALLAARRMAAIRLPAQRARLFRRRVERADPRDEARDGRAQDEVLQPERWSQHAES